MSRGAATTLEDAVLAHVARLVTAGDVEALLAGAAELVAETSGAKAAAIVLASGAEHWHGEDARLLGSLRRALEVEGRAGETRLARLVEPEGTTARISPLGVGSDQLGLVALVFEEPPASDSGPIRTTDRIVEILGQRLVTGRRLDAARAELAKTKRWFDTMDQQLRVLDRERQKFAAVMSQSDTLIFVVDPELQVQWTNAAMKARLEASGGTRVEEISLGEMWEGLEVDCPPPGSSGCPVRRALAENAVGHLESRQHVGAENRQLYLSFLPIKAPDGRVAEVLVMVQDLTDLEVLRRSESRYRRLFEGSPDAMMMAAQGSGMILLANPAALALTGFGERELSELTLEALYAPEDWAEARDDFTRIAEKGGVVHGEHRLHTRDRRPIVANVTATRFDLDGRPVTLVELQDVTEQRRLEAELQHSQKMEAVGRLAGGVATELNNIMTIILGQAELLAVHPSPDRALAEIAGVTEQAALRATLLTRKLLAFSRRGAPTAEVLDLVEVVAGLEALLQKLLGERIALHLIFGEGPCTVRADRSDLEQIAINLAANARDAMAGGGNFWLAVTRVEAAGATVRVRLEARDDGVGMAAEVLEHVFEPFFTTKPQGKGTGIGLSTVARIVDRCGGTIDVASAPVSGTSFLIELPFAEEGSRRSVPPDPGLFPYARGTERILVVADEEDVRTMAARLLGLDGYHVEVSASAEEALEICDAAPTPFDLLLTEVVMPGMAGADLAAAVRLRHPRMRVVFMSAYDEEDVVRHGVASDGAACVQKPFTRRDLALKVREVLDG